MKRKRAQMWRRLVILCLASGVFLLAGCDDDTPTEPKKADTLFLY